MQVTTFPFPSTDTSSYMRAFHQFRNKKTGLVMAHTIQPDLGSKYRSNPFVFGDAHVIVCLLVALS